MYKHDLFYLQQAWEAGLASVYKQIRTTNSQLTQCTKYQCYYNLHQNKVHAPTVNTTLPQYLAHLVYLTTKLDLHF